MFDSLLLLSRLILMLLCTEIAVRYGFWWHTARRSGAILARLLLGVCIAQAGLACAMMAATYNTLSNSIFSFSVPTFPNVIFFLVTDLFMIVGAIFHLIPCWSLNYGFTKKRIAKELAWRGGMMIPLGAFLVLRVMG